MPRAHSRSTNHTSSVHRCLRKPRAARAALLQLRALVGSGEWRWQRQLERALSLLNLWRCHESQSVASTAQQTRTAPHRKSARSSWGTVELICRRRFSTKNLRRYTVRVTRSPPRVLGLGSASVVGAVSGRREMLLTACHGIVTGLCVYVCVRFHSFETGNIMPQNKP